MIVFLIVVLGISVAGMVVLLSVKRYELSTGRILFAGARPVVSGFFAHLSEWTHIILPTIARRYVRRLWSLMLMRIQRGIAYAAVTFEETLVKVLNLVREKTEPQYPHGEPSAFLREVADHKKSLSKKSHRRDSLPQ